MIRMNSISTTPFQQSSTTPMTFVRARADSIVENLAVLSHCTLDGQGMSLAG